ncbi:hypothetical protein SEA_BOLT007_51 [Arthrobacter phage Bolt007]|uniref:Uncharacterized protein n=1 Tax=Arthrobacter phage Bolt007 TaxID=3017297 RepID=A0AA49E618_9CAUD|nr:hypothetical protein SEA_BOLT007_51 [Arthrobacter phage Bolt007]
MNWTRVSTNAGLLYVGTETDGVNFEIAKTKTGQYELTAGGEIAGTFALLKQAKADAARIEREILDDMVARHNEAAVRAAHDAEEADRAEIAEAALATLDADIDAHNARAAAHNAARPRGPLSIHVGDVVTLGHREGEWTVRRLRAHGRAEIVRASDGEIAEVPGHNITSIVLTEHPQPEAPARHVEISKAGSIVAAEERIQTAGGVSIGDRAEISGDDSVWTVNQIIEVDGDYLYRLRDETRPAGFRSTWRLGEEITLVSEDEVADVEVLGEFSREEVLSERHDAAVRFKPEQWPTTRDLFPKEFGPGVVPNDEEAAIQRRTASRLDEAREAARALSLGDRVAYSGSRGMEDWTVIGRRDQGGFLSLHLRERSGTTSWMTVGELGAAVVDGRALLISVVSSELDEAGALETLREAALLHASENDYVARARVEDRAGQPVLHLDIPRGGSFEIYATRVR